MNVNIYYTKVYKNETAFRRGKNKPNSNPNKPNFRKAKMNVNSLITKDYRKKDDFTVRINKPNSKPISSKAKMNANVFVAKDYENETAFWPQKNKPNSNPIKPCPERSRMGQFQMQSPLAQTMRFAILERRVAMAHLGRYWKTKPNVSDELT